MSKVSLIIQREYLTRVKKRSFLVTTLLTPILMIGAIAAVIYIGVKTGDVKTIEVVDNSRLFEGQFDSNDKINYSYSSGKTVDEAKGMVGDEMYGVLYIPEIDINDPQGITFYADGNPSLSITSNVEKILKTKIEDIKLQESGLDKETIDNLKANVKVESFNLEGGEEKKSNAEITTAIGYAAAFLMYMFVFIYGSQVMRGVMEEKQNRIVEVIISSVRPFQLMTGKIIGVSLVVLTQMILWIVLISVGSSLVIGTLAGGDIQEQQEVLSQGMGVPGQEEMQGAQQLEVLQDFNSVMESIDITMVLSGFLIYFLGGYLIYAALFAAVGSAVDNDQDSQQFLFPITIPLIFSILVLSIVLQDPGGPLAFWMSMIPFTSPVVMMMRLPFGVPLWELALSVTLLVGGFIFTTWLAGKIYRTGILMHGTKVTYKTLGKWITMKN